MVFVCGVKVFLRFPFCAETRSAYGDNRPWQEEAAAALSKVLRDEEAAVELWYDSYVIECKIEISEEHMRAYYFLAFSLKICYNMCE